MSKSFIIYSSRRRPECAFDLVARELVVAAQSSAESRVYTRRSKQRCKKSASVVEKTKCVITNAAITSRSFTGLGTTPLNPSKQQ